MTVLFRGRCGNCGFTSQLTPAVSGALLLDEPSGDKDADPADRRLVLMTEESGKAVIRRNGYTFARAGLRGRYLRVRDFFCWSCGGLYRTRSLALPLEKVAWQIWAAVAAPLVVFLLLVMPGGWVTAPVAAFFGLIAAGSSVALLDIVSRGLLRFRYRSRFRKFATGSRCPKCHGRRRIHPAFLKRSVGFRCPQCDRDSQSIERIDAVWGPGERTVALAARGRMVGGS